MLTNHRTTVESTTSLSYQRISSQLYRDVYFRDCSKHTDCTRSITKNCIFSVITLIIYSCIKVRIRLILWRYIGCALNDISKSLMECDVACCLVACCVLLSNENMLSMLTWPGVLKLIVMVSGMYRSVPKYYKLQHKVTIM